MHLWAGKLFQDWGKRSDFWEKQRRYIKLKKSQSSPLKYPLRYWNATLNDRSADKRMKTCCLSGQVQLRGLYLFQEISSHSFYSGIKSSCQMNRKHFLIETKSLSSKMSFSIHGRKWLTRTLCKSAFQPTAENGSRELYAKRRLAHSDYKDLSSYK